MKPGTKNAVIGGIATILAAAITAAVTIYVENQKVLDCKTEMGKTVHELEIYRQQFEAAPKTYTRDLEKLINDAPTRLKNAAQSEGGDPTDVIVSAKSIVASRDGLRSSLEAIGSRLDSQIDELKDELNKPHPDPDKLIQTLRVLRAKWPSKKDEIDVAIRSLMAQLGLVLNNQVPGKPPLPAADSQPTPHKINVSVTEPDNTLNGQLAEKSHREVWRNPDGQEIEVEWTIQPVISKEQKIDLNGSYTTNGNEASDPKIKPATAFKSLEITFSDGTLQIVESGAKRYENPSSKKIKKLIAHYELLGRAWALQWEAPQ